MVGEEGEGEGGEELGGELGQFAAAVGEGELLGGGLCA